MVDHDSRKRVAENFRPFFFQNNFQKFLKILQRFHQATQQQQQQPAAASSQQQQPAATSSQQQQPAAASMGMAAAWLLHGHAAWAWLLHGHAVASKPGCMVHGMLLLQNRDACIVHGMWRGRRRARAFSNLLNLQLCRSTAVHVLNFLVPCLNLLLEKVRG
jgi:hypothetical protein